MLKKNFFITLILVTLTSAFGYYLFRPEVWFEPLVQQQAGEETIAEEAARILQEKVEALKILPRYRYSIHTDRSPQALAAAHGRLYISYQRLNMVDIFDYEGNRIDYFDPYPKDAINAIGLATDPWDNLYIVDSQNHAILVFDPDLNFISFFPKDNLDPTDVNSVNVPAGVAINRNTVYVADMGSSMAKSFMMNGNFILGISGTGKTEKEPWHPIDIEVTEDGRMLVSDLKSRNIAVFNCMGNFAHEFALPDGKDRLQSPGGIEIDGDDRVHVLDRGSQKVFVYDNYGRFLFTYGPNESGPLQMQSSLGIAIDKEKKLVFIADSGNRQIDVWSLPK